MVKAFSHHNSMDDKQLPSDIDRREFRKANEVISPRVTRGGTLSLLSRKIFNVLLFHTQRFGCPGFGAPEGDDVFKELYWIPMAELARDSAYNSEDAQVLKDALTKLQDIKIITDNQKGYASDVLITKIRVIPSGRGKPTLIGWALDSTTEKILLSPEFYTRLSIYHLTSLRTTAGIALYENSKRYATNPSGLTARASWEWWHDVLTGLPITHEKPEYKYFKRDTLKPAIQEVNTTDIRVDLIEHKTGRRITHLQFMIGKSTQASLELPAPPLIDAKILDRIRELGIHQREAEDIFAGQEEGFLRATLDWVSERMANPKLATVESPAALFRSALRGKYAASKKPAENKKPALPAAKAKPEPQPDPELVARRQAALKTFDAMAEEGRAATLKDFAEANPALAASIRKNSGGKTVRNALAGWLLKR